MLVDKLAYQVVNKSKPIENYNIANIICCIIFQTRMLRCQSVTGELLWLLILCRIFISSCQYTAHNQHTKPGNDDNHQSPSEKNRSDRA